MVKLNKILASGRRGQCARPSVERTGVRIWSTAVSEPGLLFILL